jgi:hypothetical protein
VDVDSALTAVGLRVGESARWRRRDNERWSTGRIAAVEADGSIRVIDAKGAMRSLPVDQVEVTKKGQRGAAKWEPAAARAERTEQLGLL